MSGKEEDTTIYSDEGEEDEERYYHQQLRGKREIFQDNLEGELSNEGVYQFLINVPERKGYRTAAPKAELNRFANNWLVKDVAMDLRILRKKSIWASLCLELLQTERIKMMFVQNSNARLRGEHWTIEPALLVDLSNESILLRWFGNFVKHLMMDDFGDNQTLNSTIDVDELQAYISRTGHWIQIEKRFLDLEKLMNEKWLHLEIIGTPHGQPNMPKLSSLGLSHLLRNTINGLCTEFALENNMLFSILKPPKGTWLNLNDRLSSGGTDISNQILTSHNEHIKLRRKHQNPRGPPTREVEPKDIPAPESLELTPNNDAIIRFNSPDLPSPKKIEKATFYDAIFCKDPAGVRVSKPVIPLDVLMETEALLERGNQDKEDRPEEGWAEHALAILQKNGLDPAAYGLHAPTTVPLTPSTPTSSSEFSDPNTPKTPLNTYESFIVSQHEHPPIDASDVADAADTALRAFNEETQSPDNIEGGQFLINPAQFNGEVLAIAAPNLVTPYNNSPPSRLDESMTPTIGITDDRASHIIRESTPVLRLPSIAEVIPHIDRATPPRAIVHKDSSVCSKIAEAFITAWRMAKETVYKHYHKRHFRINHTLFATGAVCHRCYQLIRQHHEAYHLKSGHTVSHTVFPYPRKRTEKQKSSIRTDKHTELYKETRKKAYNYTKRLLRKTPHQLRKYNKRLVA